MGAAPLRHLFFGEGGILVSFNAPWATDFREKRNPPQADSIVSVLWYECKWCTIQYYHIVTLYHILWTILQNLPACHSCLRLSLTALLPLPYLVFFACLCCRLPLPSLLLPYVSWLLSCCISSNALLSLSLSPLIGRCLTPSSPRGWLVSHSIGPGPVVLLS